MTATWGRAIGSLEVTLVVVFANLVNHGMDRSLAGCRVNVLDKEGKTSSDYGLVIGLSNRFLRIRDASPSTCATDLSVPSNVLVRLSAPQITRIFFSALQAIATSGAIARQVPVSSRWASDLGPDPSRVPGLP